MTTHRSHLTPLVPLARPSRTVPTARVLPDRDHAARLLLLGLLVLALPLASLGAMLALA